MFPTPLDLRRWRNPIGKAWAFLWLIRFVPSSVAGIAVIAGLRLSAAPMSAEVVTLAVGTVFSVTSGCSAWNDYTDHPVDMINVPYRPLPSGMLSPKTAIGYSAFAYTLGAYFAIGLGTRGLMFYAPASILSFVYSPMMKKVTGAKNVFVGCFCGCILMFGGYLGGNLSRTVIPAVIVITSVTSRELLIDIHDIKGDRHGGYPTVPIVLGISKASLIVTYLLGITSFLELCVLMKNVLGFLPKIVLTASAACFFYVAVVSARHRNRSTKSLLNEIRLLMGGLLLGVTSLVI